MSLDTATLLKVLKTLTASRLARSGLGRLSDELPKLWTVARDLSVQQELEGEISRSISPTGEVMDSASQRLSDIRWQLRDTRRQLQEKLASIMKSKRGQSLLQEQLVTERNGRYVLPIRAEVKREMKGIMHDISNTGATVFIEPLETIETGNELRRLEIEERQEIERILAALSAATGAASDNILHNVNILAEIDLLLAKAYYAEKLRAIEPEISSGDGRVLKLVRARHPLLKGEAVPLTVELGEEYSILIISGPNAGGKTVALKTIGLLVLMAQAGLPLPCADGTCLPVYDRVFADIGDEQSIEQTLSTFSAHISNLARIVKDATPDSLVLLDELGISTDPGEGAALAQATLQHFLQKGTGVVVTTHYSELKAFAHLTDGARNASLDFDPVTLAPTYHLRVGMPGGSNALNIASRFGLPDEIIADARSIMSKGSQEVEAMLTDLSAERQRLDNAQAKLHDEQERAVELTARLESELARVTEQERDILREIQDNINREVAGLYRSIREADAELKKKDTREKVERARKALERISMRADEQGKKLRGRLDELKAEPVEDTVSIAAGDTVRLRDMEMMAKVISVDEDSGRLEALAGDIKMTLNIDSVEKLETPGPEADGQRTVVRPASIRPAAPELDLRGKRADAAVAEIDGYLNSAFMSHLPEVRIVHGYGTGAVRNAVREFLTGHALVKSFRPGKQGEGGDGVTVVKLT
jgi:DNA mismatch repair protein MutS2